MRCRVVAELEVERAGEFDDAATGEPFARCDLGRMSMARTATAATIRVACRRRAWGRAVGFACGPVGGWAPWCSLCHCQSAVRARCSWSRGSPVEVAVGVGGESGGAGERAEAVLDTVMADPADRGLACETHTAHGVELNQLDLNGTPGRAFYPEEHGVPAYDELIFVAKSDRLADDRLNRFLAVVERAVQALVNHPEQSWQQFIAADPALDDELNKRAWRATLTRFALRPAALDSQRYQRFGQFLLARGLIKTLPPLADYAQELQPQAAKP